MKYTYHMATPIRPSNHCILLYCYTTNLDLNSQNQTCSSTGLAYTQLCLMKTRKRTILYNSFIEIKKIPHKKQNTIFSKMVNLKFDL